MDPTRVTSHRKTIGLALYRAVRLDFGTAAILAQAVNLPKNIPKDLSELLQVMATDFSAILSGNLVGVYLWGSLTYEAFDEACSDVDCIGVTRRGAP